MGARAAVIRATPGRRLGTNVFAASVDWRLIHELREALDQLGLDWRRVKTANEAQRAAIRKGRD